MLADLPANITLGPGRLEIRADTAVAMLESLYSLAMVMHNDLDRFEAVVQPTPARFVEDEELREMFDRLRKVRVRVVAADPPIDWSKIKSYQDLTPFFDRDGSIASVMEKEVLSRHRKALMLFGIFHLVHGGGPGEGDAVTRYERHYPGKTFVIGGDFGDLDTGEDPPVEVYGPGGVLPSLIRTKNSRLGKLSLDAYIESPLFTDSDCNVDEAFKSTPSKKLADQIDAFLYLGPQQYQLVEPLPADIALDRAYRSEWLRRMKLVGLPGPSTLEEMDAQIVADAAHPVSTHASRQPVSQEMKSRIKQSCLSAKHSAASTAK